MRVHRAARIAERDDLRALDGARAARQAQELAVGRDGVAEAAARIHTAPSARRRQPAAAPRREARQEHRQQPLHRGEIRFAERLEGLRAQERLGAVARLVTARRLGLPRLPRGRGTALRSETPGRGGAVGRTPFVGRESSRRRLHAAPPLFEETVERLRVARPDLQRDPERPPQLLAVGHVDERHGLGRVRLVREARAHTALAQRAREPREVADQPSVHDAAAATSAETSPPVRSWRSCRSFRMQPSVSSTVSASSSSRWSRTSACAQSMVSATPGAFRSLRPRSA